MAKTELQMDGGFGTVVAQVTVGIEHCDMVRSASSVIRIRATGDAHRGKKFKKRVKFTRFCLFLQAAVSGCYSGLPRITPMAPVLIIAGILA